MYLKVPNCTRMLLLKLYDFLKIVIFQVRHHPKRFKGENCSSGRSLHGWAKNVNHFNFISS